MFPLGVLNRSQPVETLILMHFDGTHGSTNFIDSGPLALPFSTKSGSPIISTTQSVFGGSSLYLNGSSSIQTPDDPSIEFGNKDFTYEMFLYLDGTQDGRFVLQKDISHYFFLSWTSRILAFSLYGYNLASLNPIPLNTTTHVAVIRKNTALRMYINGVLNSTIRVPTNFTVTDSSNALVLGNLGGGSPMKGYIDEFRVCRGAAYLGDFTPPISPYS